MRPEVDWQPSLFDGDPPALDVSYAGLRRLQLDEHSWVDDCPGWLTGSDVVFATLAQEARWQQRTVHMYDREVLEPRLTAGWSTDADDGGTPTVLGDMAGALSQRYGVGFDEWVNLYRDGSGQRRVARRPEPPLSMTRPLVATVSLGARAAVPAAPPRHDDRRPPARTRPRRPRRHGR